MPSSPEGQGFNGRATSSFPMAQSTSILTAVFNTAPEYCETFGHDLGYRRASEGATVSRADNPQGRAIIKASDYIPPYEQPDKQYPLWLTTGRIVYHFHTRTKTGRVPALEEKAPDAFVEISQEDAASYGVQEGDMLEVRSRRGFARAPARLTGIRRGLLFMPFHYGYWDNNDRPRAANELTLPEWDPVSKQPHYKLSAVRIRKVGQ